MKFKLVLFILCMTIVTFVKAYPIATFGEHHVGNNFKRLSCRPNHVLVGLEIKAGQYLDKIAIMCSQIENNGSLKSPINGGSYFISIGAAVASLLPGVNSIERTFLCRSGFVLSGLSGKSGDWVDRISELRCTKFRGNDKHTIDVRMGGTGGNSITGNCRDTDIIDTFTAHYGSWTDQLSITCKEQDIATTSTTTTQSTARDAGTRRVSGTSKARAKAQARARSLESAKTRAKANARKKAVTH